jgi:hypothetical protein
VKLTYRWYRAGHAISGATGTTYKPKSVDKGHTVSVKVTGTRSGFRSATATGSVKVK